MRVLGLPRPALLLLAGGAILAAGHLAWYAGTPSGRHPVLDGREIANLAKDIASGGLPAEPFYRAPLYSALLAGPLELGLDARLLPDAARFLNLAALLLTAWGAGRLADRLWNSSLAGALAAGLVAANPVLHFFAGDPSDILCATALFTLAVSLALTSGRIAAPGLLLGLGTLLRSQLLLPALAWPLWVAWRSGGARWKTAARAAAGPLAALLALGLANLALSGELRLTPWQGAYNLWAGNGPQANGRHFTQATRVEFRRGFDNPARLESVALYEQETGASPPHDIAAMNRHWTAKTLRHIAAHPLDWLGLMARKTAALLHHHEQYDNKTYSFQKELSPWLRWNPLGWGWLLAAATPGWLALRRRQPAVAHTLLFLAAVYAAGVVLFHTNNRFRVPLVPVLAVCAAGLPVWWRDVAGRRHALLLAATVAALALPPWPALARDRTTLQDIGLLAVAAQEAGDDHEARTWAEQGLRLAPQRDDLREIVLLADFNLMLARATPPGRSEIARQLERCTRIAAPTAELRYVRAVYSWKLGDRAAAQRDWIALVEAAPDHPPPAPLAALLLTDPDNPRWRELAGHLPPARRGAWLEAVLAGSAGHRALAGRLFAPVNAP